jgi:hypothetical protein
MEMHPEGSGASHEKVGYQSSVFAVNVIRSNGFELTFFLSPVSRKLNTYELISDLIISGTRTREIKSFTAHLKIFH